MRNEERKRSLEELPRALRTFLSASDAFDEALGNVLGLNATDVRCVDLLDQYGTMTAGALASVAGLSTGAVTFLLDRLERAGFVRRLRDVEDRRRVHVELVPFARTRISELHAGLAEAWRTSAQQFSLSDLQSIIAFLREGAKLYEAQVPVLCSQVPAGTVSPTSAGRAAIKAAVKAQAKAEAMEKLEQTARKLQAKANELHHKAGRL
jgi:DNA-binding MarR family transcriptional regulator